MSIPSIDARPYGPDTTPAELDALRARVWKVEDRIYMFEEIPVQTVFSLDLLFDRLEELVAGEDRFAYIVDLRGVRRRGSRAAQATRRAPQSPARARRRGVRRQRRHSRGERRHRLHRGPSGGDVTRNILVVDDDPDLRETLALLLADHAVTVTAVASGGEALAVLADGSPPDLILLDLMMPEMNGWQFLEHIRSAAALASIPVVIMTAHPVDDPFPAPVKETLRKPFAGATLLAAIARHATSG